MGMALDFLLGVPGSAFNDTYLPPSPFSYTNACRVLIRCPGKKIEIGAMLSEGFSIDAKSEWKSLFASGMAGMDMTKILGVIDNSAQIIAGHSIRQPYFGRKYWVGTEPLKFQLALQFVSFSNTYIEVYKPAKDKKSRRNRLTGRGFCTIFIVMDGSGGLGCRRA